MTFQVRPFQPADYPAITEVFRALDPESTATPERIERADRRLPPKNFRQRWVAEREGRVMGHAVLRHDEYFWDPRQYALNAWVLPEEQRKGVGSALFDAVWARLSELDHDLVQSPVPERHPEGVRFLEKRGFRESHRNFQSARDLADFDPSAYLAIERRLAARGIQIAKLADLAGVPGHRHEIFELQPVVDDDIPGQDLRHKMSFEEFWHHIETELSGGEPFYVALDAGRPVGLHFGFVPPGANFLNVALTGVLPSYRGMGLATVLKARGMSYARERGLERVTTWNDSRNAPMLALNVKMGFQRKFGAIYMTWKPEEDSVSARP